MGAVLAKFRKEQSTEKKLELLEEKIQTLEKYTYNTQERKKRFVGTFLAVSIGIYVIAAIAIIYFVYFPRTWKERFIYIVPMLIFPFLIIWLRRLFKWYFERKLNKNADKLTTLREEKRKILDQVMDKETYKVAVNLLNRFGGVSNNSSRLSLGAPRTPYGAANNQAMRALATKPSNPPGAPSPAAAASNQALLRPNQQQQQQMSRTSQSLTATPILRTDQHLRRRTPFPIVNQAEKSFFERCLDVIIGDGPQDRFAIICRECHSHNGMGLKEEFDFIAFRCAFCNAMNPARKTRPVAPRLSLPAPSNELSPRMQLPASDSSVSTPTSDSSDDDSDEKNKRRIQFRLTESTANQSERDELPEVKNHEIQQATASSTLVNEPVAVEEELSKSHTPEPMDVVEEDENDASSSAATSSPSKHKKVD